MIDVAIDARVTRRMSVGTRVYQRELLARLPHVAPDIRFATFRGGENLTVRELVVLPFEIARLHPRVVHYLTIFAPPVTPAPYVVTIHDLIHLRHPEMFSSAPARYYALLGGRFARNAARLIVGDERTIEDCERFLGVPGERCRVVPLGYDPQMLAAVHGDDGPAAQANVRPYFLYAGNHRPHKNLATLFAAWRDLPNAVDVDLWCTGDDADGAAQKYTRRNGRLRFLGTVDERRLWAAYRDAIAYVHPALAEGFGIPMLEALVLGTPVIAAHEAVPSIVRPHATVFPARDVTALRDALIVALSDRTTLRRASAEGAAAVRAYTWDRFAAGIAAVYREVA